MEMNGYVVNNKGVQFDETNQGKGNSDKRNLL